MIFDDTATLAERHDEITANLERTGTERRQIQAFRQSVEDELAVRTVALRCAKVAKDPNEYGPIPALLMRISGLREQDRELSVTLAAIDEFRNDLLARKETVERTYRPRILEVDAA